MNKRPLSVTVLGWLFIAAGAVGLTYHAREFKAQHPFEAEILWILLLRILAIVCGVFLLRGHNWARWLLLVWIGYHVVLSAFHPLSELIIHSLLLAIVAWFLFRPRASGYFRNAHVGPAPPPKAVDPGEDRRDHG